VKPVLVVRIPDMGEVRFDRHGYRTFRPEQAKADLVFERIRAIERAMIDRCRTRDASPAEQIDALLAAYPEASVGILTDESSEAPKSARNGRWQSQWGG
jgi:hypothetical protein